MEIVYLKNDGRCKWLEKQVLKKVFPEAIKSAYDINGPIKIMIVDWISNDGGKVGVDLKWFKKLGVPAVQSYQDLPKDNNFILINTGYDSIVDEEKALKERGIKIIDKPCPYVRRIRRIFENIDNRYQYVLLCEPNHIIIKNYKSLFPKDMILVQMQNYKERIVKQENGKPIMFISYVTFLRKYSNEVFDFICTKFPERKNEMVNTQCMWADGKMSPIKEIATLPDTTLRGIKYACLIATAGSTNKSLMSLYDTITSRGLEVVKISSLKEFIHFKHSHKSEKILLVRSPIPNQAERPIMAYLKNGLIAGYCMLFLDKTQLLQRLKIQQYKFASLVRRIVNTLQPLNISINGNK